jgi:hypothetical protein
MESVREVKLGGVASQAIMVATAWWINKLRESAVHELDTYQHKGEESDGATFLGVYAKDDERRQAEQAKLYNPRKALYPEDSMQFYSIDRVIVQADSNPHRNPGERVTVAIVIMRRPWTGAQPVGVDEDIPNDNDVAIRLRVTITSAYAENGNMYKMDTEVTELN